MQIKLKDLKDFGWAIGIIICLVALFIGLVIASVNRYSGSKITTSTPISQESAENNSDVTTLAPGSGGNLSNLITLDETPDAGQEYIDRLTFLCDSSFIGVRDYGLLSGGTNTDQVWGTDSGSMFVSNLSTASIVLPPDGSTMSIADAAMVRQPEILIVVVGQDGLNAVDETEFKTAYAAMLNSIHSASEDTKIVCCSISSVTSNYSGADGLTTIMISDANDWIRDVCASMNIRFCDAGKAVGDGTGSVEASYLSSNGKTLNSSGINEILTYLRTHKVQEDN